MSDQMFEWILRPDWLLGTEEQAILEKFLVVQLGIFARCAERFERLAREESVSSLRSVYEEQAAGYRRCLREAEEWREHVRAGMIPGNVEEEVERLSMMQKGEKEEGREMNPHLLKHIPPQELAIFAYALESVVGDLSYRAASITNDPQATTTAWRTAVRYRANVQTLEGWQQRLAEESPLSVEDLRMFITFLMDLAYAVGGFGCNDLESDFPFPEQEVRREMKRQYYEWINSSEEQDALASFEHPFTTYSSLLGYFAYRLNPDIERQIRQAEH